MVGFVPFRFFIFYLLFKAIFCNLNFASDLIDIYDRLVDPVQK
ncbi:unnamed protein product [Acidocella sp. C78]|nr:unnamed protein product [Acidocella sp. C78]